MSVTRNTTYNVIGTLVPVIVALVTIPIYIKMIGDERYAVLSIAWLLLGYFGVFDLGIGKAAAQRISILQTKSYEKSVTFWTALSLNASLGALGGIVILPVAQYFFSEQFKVDSNFVPEILNALPWLVLAVPLATITSVLNGALQGMEKFAHINIINSTGSILFQVLPLFVALQGIVDLEVLLAVAIVARFSGLIVLFFVAVRFVSYKRVPTFSGAEARKLLKFGGWVAISSFVSPIMVMADRFIIGAVLGAKAVTIYAVPYQLAERSTLIPNALGSSLFPRFAKGGKSDPKVLAIDSINILQLFMTSLILIVILQADFILSIWISPDFAKESSLVLKIILIGFWVNGLARIPFNMLQASGKPKIVAISHLVQILPYCLLLLVGLNMWGIEGAAFAFSLRVFFDYVLLGWLSGILIRTLPLLIFGVLSLITALVLSLQDISFMTMAICQISLILITLQWSVKQSPHFLKVRLGTLIKKLAI